MQEDLDDADQEAQAASLVYLIALARFLLLGHTKSRVIVL